MTYKIPASVLRANLDSEEVLLNTSTGKYHLLNATGQTIVERLEAGGSEDDAVSEVAGRTGAPIARVQADVASFIEALLERGLLER